MYKFIEWLVGYFSGINGVNFAFGLLNFIDGYAYGYQKVNTNVG